MGGGEIVRYLSRHGSKSVIKAGLVATVVPGLAKNNNNPHGVDPAFFDGLKDSLRKSSSRHDVPQLPSNRRSSSSIRAPHMVCWSRNESA
jgi:hypothetical protein